MKPITLVLADDHEIFRDGLKALLKKQKDIDLVGEASNGSELLEVVEKKQPDIVMTDIQMPLINGIEATRIIKSKHPGIGIIALSMYMEESLVVYIITAGASGYLVKNVSKPELVEAVKSVCRGESYYSTAMSRKLLDRLTKIKFHQEYLKPQFTKREIEVLRLICKEYTHKEIASILSLSPRTIEGIRENIQKKIGAKNTIGIAVYAIKNRIVNPDE
jgi:DNA-binding NarL/FixJ family response regulator